MARWGDSGPGCAAHLIHMDDRLNIFGQGHPQEPPQDSPEGSREQSSEPASSQDAPEPSPIPDEQLAYRSPDEAGLLHPGLHAAPETNAAEEWTPRASYEQEFEDSPRRRNLRHNFSLLLALTLAAFVLTAWMLVRGQPSFGVLSAGPQDVVRAQLRAVDLGELRTAYAMFSPHFRQEVSFEEWNHLITTHWRMFHTEVLDAGEPAKSGSGVTVEFRLRGADDRGYRARFTLVRLGGRWWVDDLHWSDEASDEDTSRT